MSDILDFLWSAFAFHRIDSLPSLFFDFVSTTISASAAKHSYNQTNQQTNKKSLQNPLAIARVHFHIDVYICIEWRLLIRYCTVSILESWIKMIWNFDLQESRMTTFSLVVLPIFMKITTYLPVCAQCAMRIVWELTFDESQSQPVDEALERKR